MNKAIRIFGILFSHILLIGGFGMIKETSQGTFAPGGILLGVLVLILLWQFSI